MKKLAAILLTVALTFSLFSAPTLASGTESSESAGKETIVETDSTAVPDDQQDETDDPANETDAPMGTDCPVETEVPQETDSPDS